MSIFHLPISVSKAGGEWACLHWKFAIFPRNVLKKLGKCWKLQILSLLLLYRFFGFGHKIWRKSQLKYWTNKSPALETVRKKWVSAGQINFCYETIWAKSRGERSLCSISQLLFTKFRAKKNCKKRIHQDSGAYVWTLLKHFVKTRKFSNMHSSDWSSANNHSNI